MRIEDFKIERYFAKYEFKVKYLLSASDCESVSVKELLAMADKKSLKLWKDLRLHYTDSQGHPLLRAEIAKIYNGIKPNDIIVATPEECIFILMNVLLEKGDEISTIVPAYQSSYSIAEALGCKVNKIPLQLKGQKWHLDTNTLERSITSKTKLIAVNFPNNPTGYLPSRGEFNEIVRIAARHNVYLFSDEMYRFLEYDGERLPAGCEVYNKGISLFGLSKTFGLPGLRIGWLVTKDNGLINGLLAFKDYTTICNSAPSEILGIIALMAKVRLIAKNLGIIKRNIGMAESFFGRNRERFNWIAPSAGSVAFPQLLGAKINNFCDGLLMKKDTMLLPGTVFGSRGNHFRVGLGRQNFPEALKQLEAYVDG